MRYKIKPFFKKLYFPKFTQYLTLWPSQQVNHSTFFFKLQTYRTFFKSFKILLFMPLIAYSISPFIKADTDRGTLKNTNNYNEEISTFSNSENNGEKYADCPCLGGMAHGPCGKEFKDAFSCFVYSKEEPKGMECIKKFQAMQECFKKYPEIYNNEISNEDDIEITESNDL